MIRFSIVIPLYNKASEIARTLQCVMEQTYKEWELIVVDDGSTDDGPDIVAPLLSPLGGKARLVRQENTGVCAARNRGIEEAQYEYIAFLDADDIWALNYLEEQARMITDFPEAAMWGMNWVEKNEQEEIHLYTGLPADFRGYVENYFGFKHVSDFFWSTTVVIRKDAFNVAGLFDTRIRYSEDLDMWYRIILNYPVAFNAACLAEYRLDSSNRAMNRVVRLMQFLPYYVDKYEAYCEQDKTFAHFIHTFAASHLISYYFGKQEFDDAKVAVKKLRYQDIHWKYTLFYRLPYPIGLLFYKLMLWKKR